MALTPHGHSYTSRLPPPSQPQFLPNPSTLPKIQFSLLPEFHPPGSIDRKAAEGFGFAWNLGDGRDWDREREREKEREKRERLEGGLNGSEKVGRSTDSGAGAGTASGQGIAMVNGGVNAGLDGDGDGDGDVIDENPKKSKADGSPRRGRRKKSSSKRDHKGKGRADQSSSSGEEEEEESLTSYHRWIMPSEDEMRRKVEYDMDEQDHHWLLSINNDRTKKGQNPISFEIFEVVMDRLEKEWFELSGRIPRPGNTGGSGGNAAIGTGNGNVGGRGSVTTGTGRDGNQWVLTGNHNNNPNFTTGVVGGGEDTKCAICDDGECENSNAIVFCDGCNLAVHQDCYGVPYIPEGQWLCRKCTVSPHAPVKCALCPNTYGAFKQTTSGTWAHLLCALWIPETQVGNTVYMEPVEGIERINKARWKLVCSLCRLKNIGCCVQCSNRNCTTAFHITCARERGLYLRMKPARNPPPPTTTTSLGTPTTTMAGGMGLGHGGSGRAGEGGTTASLEDGREEVNRIVGAGGGEGSEEELDWEVLEWERERERKEREKEEAQRSKLVIYCERHGPKDHILPPWNDHYQKRPKHKRKGSSRALVTPNGDDSQSTTSNNNNDNHSTVLNGGGTLSPFRTTSKSNNPHMASSKAARAYKKHFVFGPPTVPRIIYQKVANWLDSGGTGNLPGTAGGGGSGGKQIAKREGFLMMCIRYWALKREARRGAPLLKRLHLEPWTASASSSNNNNNNWLQTEVERKRKQESIIHISDDLEKVRTMAVAVWKREREKLKRAQVFKSVVDNHLFGYETLMKEAMEKIMAFDNKNLFRDPVDRSEVPDYYEHIKFPMDWSTILDKLSRHSYLTISELHSDIQLIFSNAKSYNMPETVYWKTADKMDGLVREILKPFEEKMEEMEMEEIEDLERLEILDEKEKEEEKRLDETGEQRMETEVDEERVKEIKDFLLLAREMEAMVTPEIVEDLMSFDYPPFQPQPLPPPPTPPKEPTSIPERESELKALPAQQVPSEVLEVEVSEVREEPPREFSTEKEAEPIPVVSQASPAEIILREEAPITPQAEEPVYPMNQLISTPEEPASQIDELLSSVPEEPPEPPSPSPPPPPPPPSRSLRFTFKNTKAKGDQPSATPAPAPGAVVPAAISEPPSEPFSAAPVPPAESKVLPPSITVPARTTRRSVAAAAAAATSSHNTTDADIDAVLAIATQNVRPVVAEKQDKDTSTEEPPEAPKVSKQPVLEEIEEYPTTPSNVKGKGREQQKLRPSIILPSRTTRQRARAEAAIFNPDNEEGQVSPVLTGRESTPVASTSREPDVGTPQDASIKTTPFREPRRTRGYVAKEQEALNGLGLDSSGGGSGRNLRRYVSIDDAVTRAGKRESIDKNRKGKSIKGKGKAVDMEPGEIESDEEERPLPGREEEEDQQEDGLPSLEDIRPSSSQQQSRSESVLDSTSPTKEHGLAPSLLPQAELVDFDEPPARRTRKSMAASAAAAVAVDEPEEKEGDTQAPILGVSDRPPTPAEESKKEMPAASPHSHRTPSPKRRGLRSQVSRNEETALIDSILTQASGESHIPTEAADATPQAPQAIGLNPEREPDSSLDGDDVQGVGPLPSVDDAAVTSQVSDEAESALKKPEPASRLETATEAQASVSVEQDGPTVSEPVQQTKMPISKTLKLAPLEIPPSPATVLSPSPSPTSARKNMRGVAFVPPRMTRNMRAREASLLTEPEGEIEESRPKRPSRKGKGREGANELADELISVPIDGSPEIDDDTIQPKEVQPKALSKVDKKGKQKESLRDQEDLVGDEVDTAAVGIVGNQSDEIQEAAMETEQSEPKKPAVSTLGAADSPASPFPILSTRPRRSTRAFAFPPHEAQLEGAGSPPPLDGLAEQPLRRYSPPLPDPEVLLSRSSRSKGKGKAQEPDVELVPKSPEQDVATGQPEEPPPPPLESPKSLIAGKPLGARSSKSSSRKRKSSLISSDGAKSNSPETEARKLARKEAQSNWNEAKKNRHNEWVRRRETTPVEVATDEVKDFDYFLRFDKGWILPEGTKRHRGPKNVSNSGSTSSLSPAVSNSAIAPHPPDSNLAPNKSSSRGRSRGASTSSAQDDEPRSTPVDFSLPPIREESVTPKNQTPQKKTAPSSKQSAPKTKTNMSATRSSKSNGKVRTNASTQIPSIVSSDLSDLSEIPSDDNEDGVALTTLSPPPALAKRGNSNLVQHSTPKSELRKRSSPEKLPARSAKRARIENQPLELEDESELSELEEEEVKADESKIPDDPPVDGVEDDAPMEEDGDDPQKTPRPRTRRSNRHQKSPSRRSSSPGIPTMADARESIEATFEAVPNVAESQGENADVLPARNEISEGNEMLPPPSIPSPSHRTRSTRTRKGSSAAPERLGAEDAPASKSKIPSPPLLPPELPSVPESNSQPPESSSTSQTPARLKNLSRPDPGESSRKKETNKRQRKRALVLELEKILKEHADKVFPPGYDDNEAEAPKPGKGWRKGIKGAAKGKTGASRTGYDGLEEGDLVWAKINGFDWFPAEVSNLDADDVPENIKSMRPSSDKPHVLVMFFDRSHGIYRTWHWVVVSQIRMLKEHDRMDEILCDSAYAKKPQEVSNAYNWALKHLASEGEE